MEHVPQADPARLDRHLWSVGDVVVVAAAAAGLVWCLVAGVLIWTAPVRGSVIEWRMGPTGMRAVERIEDGSFADISLLGVVPLAIPVLLAGFALWAAWCRSILGLIVTTLVFLVFCIITGFSIGGAYTPAGLCLVAASLVAVGSRIMARGDSRP